MEHSKSILKLDKWQEEVLKTKGNICLCSGRQVGKSFVISLKAAQYAVHNKNKTILVIASVERQAYLLFEKILAYLSNYHKWAIKKGKDRPTKHKIELTNGCKIYCLPTGLSGYGIRGFTVDLLIADEAAFIPEEVWTAVTPMLATTKGSIVLLSTPHGKGGYYYDCFSNPAFKSFHVSSENCPRMDKIFLAREKERMTKLEYAQEYLGEFVDDLMQFFSTKLITEICTLKRKNKFKHKDYFLGVDVAGMGKDETTFEILDGTNKEQIEQVENIITTKTRTTDTTNKIIELEKEYNFKRIGIDDGGIGVGVFDFLLTEDTTRRKIEALNNASRPLDNEETRKKRLLKEDMYNNLLRLMEQKKIKLLDDDEIIMSLKSIQYEYTDEGKLKIFGKYSHIAEGLIRAAWLIKTKSLNIYLY